MQRLYSMFPAGRAGAGLLILRVVVALQLPAVSACCARPVLVDWMEWLAQATAVLLCVGILTPLLALLCAAMAAFCLLNHGSQIQPLLPMFGLVIANAIASGLLGPGAYSLDAKFFGRRLILVNDKANQTEPQ
ncbi:hypothetical protein UNDKW_4153 [Undibacterium sp. KW1]|uniref:hypothetical protein n=1 Tax=Undibacterium sp. KW1 TaxID=2058624 RepID=UPI001331CCA1|nr:hypothetical protein [Undibacterium sp. KW1]BBB62426.1 hypothetical protein UNDKW_4153 [Undibacterium sp. KW1]